MTLLTLSKDFSVSSDNSFNSFLMSSISFSNLDESIFVSNTKLPSGIHEPPPIQNNHQIHSLILIPHQSI